MTAGISARDAHWRRERDRIGNHREAVRWATVGIALLVLLLPASCPAQDDGRVDWREIRVLKPGSEAAGCEFRGMAQDDDMEDVLKKARKIYGDTVVMKDAMRGKDFLVEVYRCAAKEAAK